MERTFEASVGRVPIVNVQPSLEEGRWPARAVIGEAVPISATIFREGHDSEGATAVVTDPAGKVHSFPMPLNNWGNALYVAQFLPTKQGHHSFRVEAWSDPVGTWLHAAELKIQAGVDVQLMIDEGVLVLSRARDEVRRPPRAHELLSDAIATLTDGRKAPDTRLEAAMSPKVRDLLTKAPLRESVTASREYPLVVQREEALVSAWYEIFPRSEGAKLNKRTGEWKSGTFATAAERLDAGDVAVARGDVFLHQRDVIKAEFDCAGLRGVGQFA